MMFACQTKFYLFIVELIYVIVLYLDMNRLTEFEYILYILYIVYRYACESSYKINVIIVSELSMYKSTINQLIALLFKITEGVD